MDNDKNKKIAQAIRAEQNAQMEEVDRQIQFTDIDELDEEGTLDILGAPSDKQLPFGKFLLDFEDETGDFEDYDENNDTVHTQPGKKTQKDPDGIKWPNRIDFSDVESYIPKKKQTKASKKEESESEVEIDHKELVKISQSITAYDDSEFEITRDVIKELGADTQLLEDVEYHNRALVAILQEYLNDTDWYAYLRNLEDFGQLVQIDSTVLVCKTYDCPYVEKCPIMRSIKGKPNEIGVVKSMHGNPCRVERSVVIQTFAGLVNELGIGPKDTTDLLTLTSLVSMTLLQTRVFWQIAVEGATVPSIAGIKKYDDEPVYNYIPNGHFKTLETIEKVKDGLLAQLNATRAAKANSANQLDSLKKDLLMIFGIKNTRELNKRLVIDVE